jgi:hypothetical protein
MLKLLQSIFGVAADDQGIDEDLIRRATERVLDGTDPRLRAVSRYQKRLRDPVVKAVSHVIALVDAIPLPVEISRRRFAEEPRLRAFFVSADHLQETVSYSDDLQKYLRQTPATTSPSIHCLLTLDRTEKGVLGMALRGDSVSRDVAQTVVNFSNHRLVGFAESEPEMRRELMKRAFDFLIETALANLTMRREQADALDKRQRVLRRKLEAIRAGNWSMSALLTPETARTAEHPQVVEAQLADIERELDLMQADTATLEGQLNSVGTTLGAPEQHLRLERTTLTIDAMGVLLEGEAVRRAPVLELDELVGGERRRVMLPGFVLRADLLPRRDFVTEAQQRLRGGR